MQSAIFYLSWKFAPGRQPIEVGDGYAYIRVELVDTDDPAEVLNLAEPQPDESVMFTQAPAVRGLLRERPGHPLETDAICMQHGNESVPGKRDVVLTDLDAQDRDLIVKGIKCDRCGSWLIEPLARSVAS